MVYRFIMSLVMALLVALFALLNSKSVEINFLFAKYTISQALVIIISAIAGAVVVLFLAVIQQIKLNYQIKGSVKTVQRLEEENKELKAKIEQITVKPVEGNICEGDKEVTRQE